MQSNILRSQQQQLVNAKGHVAAQPPRLSVPSTTSRRGVLASADSKGKINIIPNNGRDEGRSFGGIPPVMGGHLMPSDIVMHFPQDGLKQGLTRKVLEAAEAAIAQRGAFTLVLSGGSLPNLLSGLVDPKQAAGAAFDKWYVMYVDERNVPHDHPDSTHKAVREALLSKVGIPPENIIAIAENTPVEQAAINYEGRMIGLPPTVLPRNEANFPVCDLILLGLGPDGHIASLFPNHPALAITDRWIAPVSNSPKPPPERITFTLPVINAAKEVIVVAGGESKAEIVQRVLEVQALPGALPAQLVRPKTGKLYWYLDVASVTKLNISNWDNSKAFPRST
ncbi:hypothetical protein DUNSADRAFT_17121 [Dunaliella salina]|uniref:Glucosamine/galactosamine-6-phosphate isomerase domain-containing protein n=1 Tax=Dunaliella salina TaxID=3046 RepID=A0ABQ7G2B4_DUNSA|nr:hypothetical protein DUNSADRAFT_17121 [Dunaliella salina]|eukprot:KAF5828743.1 hypothetical protein DUNSADRAFT_17121 [Dunaliella salina]